MNQKSIILIVLRVIILAIIIAILSSIDFLGLKLTVSWGSNLFLISLMALLQSMVISYPVIRSRWSGWKLILTIFFIYYGVTTFMTQIESVVFLQYLVDIIPVEATPGLFLNGAISAVIISPVAVILYGKYKKSTVENGTNQRLIMPAKQWIWKVLIIAVIYVFIYLLFGALVAKPLAGKAFDEYYANLQMPSWIIPFQILRGIIWILISLPIIRMMKGKIWETKLAVSLVLSVLISSLVIPPNEFMPSAIRHAHFVEIFLSMFLFGWITVWILTFKRKTKGSNEQ